MKRFSRDIFRRLKFAWIGLTAESCIVIIDAEDCCIANFRGKSYRLARLAMDIMTNELSDEADRV